MNKICQKFPFVAEKILQNLEDQNLTKIKEASEEISESLISKCPIPLGGVIIFVKKQRDLFFQHVLPSVGFCSHSLNNKSIESTLTHVDQNHGDDGNDYQGGPEVQTHQDEGHQEDGGQGDAQGLKGVWPHCQVPAT